MAYRLPVTPNGGRNAVTSSDGAAAPAPRDLEGGVQAWSTPDAGRPPSDARRRERLTPGTAGVELVGCREGHYQLDRADGIRRRQGRPCAAVLVGDDAPLAGRSFASNSLRTTVRFEEFHLQFAKSGLVEEFCRGLPPIQAAGSLFITRRSPPRLRAPLH